MGQLTYFSFTCMLAAPEIRVGNTIIKIAICLQKTLINQTVQTKQSLCESPIAMAMIFSWVVYCSFVEKKVDNHSGGLCSFAINKSNSCFRVKNPSLWNAAFIQDLQSLFSWWLSSSSFSCFCFVLGSRYSCPDPTREVVSNNKKNPGFLTEASAGAVCMAPTNASSVFP